MKLNLIPKAILDRHARRRRLGTWGATLALSVGALAIPVTLNWTRQIHAEHLRREQAEVSEARSHVLAEWATVRGEVTETEAQVMRAEALRSKRAWSSLLGLVAQSVPEKSWLTGLATDPAQPVKAAAKRTPRPRAGGASDAATENITVQAPRALELQGYAPTDADANQFVQSLKQRGVFQDVRLTRLTRSSLTEFDGEAYFFDIVCEW